MAALLILFSARDMNHSQLISANLFLLSFDQNPNKNLINMNKLRRRKDKINEQSVVFEVKIKILVIFFVLHTE